VNEKINALYLDPKKPLLVNFKEVFNDVHEIDSLWKKIKKITATETNCTITNNSYDSENMQFDAFQQEIYSYKIKDLKTNPYLEEAISIVNDFNLLNK
jgi:carboxyl-terminal processing protease